VDVISQNKSIRNPFFLGSFFLLISVSFFPWFFGNSNLFKEFLLWVFSLLAFLKISKQRITGSYFIPILFLLPGFFLGFIFCAAEAVREFFIFIFFFFFMLEWRKTQDPKVLSFFISFAAFLVGFLGLLNFYGISFFGDALPGAFSRGFIISSFGNVNWVSDFLAGSFFVTLIWVFSAKKRVALFFSLASLFICLTVVLLAQTRTVYFGMLLAAFLWVVFSWVFPENRKIVWGKRKRVALVVAVIGSSLFFFLFPPFSPEDAEKPWETSIERTSLVVEKGFGGSLDKRFLEWSTAWEMFKEKPIFGWGFSSFQFLSPDFQAQLTEQPGVFFGRYQKDYEAHNEWLEILAEAGIFGFVPLAILIGLTFFRGIKTIKRVPLIGVSFFSAWIVPFVHSFFEFPFQIIPNLFLFGIISNFFFQQNKRDFSPFPKPRLEKVVLVFSMVLLLVPGFFLGSLLASDFFGTQAIRASNTLEKFFGENPGFFALHKIFSSSHPGPALSESFQDTGSEQMKIAEKKITDVENLLLLSSRNALRYNPKDFFYTALFGKAVKALEFQKEMGSLFLAAVSPLPRYEHRENILSSLRNPPEKGLTLPDPSGWSREDFWKVRVLRDFSEVMMKTVYMPVDPAAFLNIAVSCSQAIKLMGKYGTAEEIWNPWLEWMKYSFDYAFRLKRDFSGVTEGMDLVYLNALKEFDPDPTSFENALVYYLDNWKKLVAHGLQPGLSEGWKEMIAENLDGLSPGVREKVVELREQTLELERGKP